MYTFGPLIAKNSRSGRLLGGAPVTVTALDGTPLATAPAGLVTNHEGYLPAFTVDTDQVTVMARPRGGDPLPLHAHEGIQGAAEVAETVNTGRLSEDALESTIDTRATAAADAAAGVVDFARGALPNGADANTYLTPGIYRKSSSAVVANLPPVSGTAVGFLVVYNLRNPAFAPTWGVQEFYVYGSAPERWWRVSRSTSGAWNDWQKVPTLADIPTPETSTIAAGPYRRDDLVQRFLARRGGTIGTNGVPAVALRFDHHLNPFRDKVLPLLTEHGLPWAQIVNPDRVGTYPTDNDVTWAELQQMALDHGGEVWNHGANHGDATTEAQLHEQIVDSLHDLQANLPALAIEGWAPPGLADGAYMGAAPFKTTEQNTATYAGQLIMAHHAAIAGYADGFYRPLYGGMPIGAPHQTIDSLDTAGALSYVTVNTQRRTGLAFMLHPNMLDEPGRMTTAQLDAFFAELAARRDAGEIVVLSYSGLWAADARTGYRHDLARTHSAATVAAGASRDINIPTGNTVAHYLGGIRELVVPVTTNAEGTATVAVTGKPTTTHTLRDGVNVIRRPITIAHGAPNITVSVTPTVAATVGPIRLQAT